MFLSNISGSYRGRCPTMNVCPLHLVSPGTTAPVSGVTSQINLSDYQETLSFLAVYRVIWANFPYAYSKPQWQRLWPEVNGGVLSFTCWPFRELERGKLGHSHEANCLNFVFNGMACFCCNFVSWWGASCPAEQRCDIEIMVEYIRAVQHRMLENSQ